MSITRCLGLTLLAVTLMFHETVGAAVAVAKRPRVGEVRALAITLSNEDVKALHRGGWLEAHGQLLSTRAFPELFKVVGRKWTTSGMKGDQFALPEIRDRSQRGVSSDDPAHVIDPSDLVTGGLVDTPWRHRTPLSYWIFAGRAVNWTEVVQSRASRP